MSGLKKNPVANQTLVFDFVTSNFHGGYNGFVGKFNFLMNVVKYRTGIYCKYL
jgi:hypothetical protein